MIFPALFLISLVRLAAAKEKEKDDKGEDNDDGDKTRQRNQNTHKSLLVNTASLFKGSDIFYLLYDIFSEKSNDNCVRASIFSFVFKI